MGPKKKQEEIDLATLPECRTLNVIVQVRGRKARAAAIQQRLQKECDRLLVRVRKAEVLDHAKEKGIYVDPASLSDKQKKDPKFMETVSTELTPEVVARALKSHLAALTLKARIERKANPLPEDKNRKYDLLYALEDLPDSTNEFEELAKCAENVRFVLVVEPRVSWAAAPELPDPADQEEEEDEEVKEYRALLKKEERTQEDTDYEAQVDARIAQIRHLRSQAKRDSEFRNCTISIVDAEIDPYNEDASLAETVRLLLEAINKLTAEMAEFEEWRKERKAESMGEPVQVAHSQPQGSSVLSLLDSLAHGLDNHPSAGETDDEQDMLALINSFSTAPAALPLANSNVSDQDKPSNEEFVGWNEYVGAQAALENEVRSRVRAAGIDRFLMPEVASKSEGVRRAEEAAVALFLGGMPAAEYTRRQQLLNFEEYLREFDQDRVHSLAARNYEEHHDRASLQRELLRAMELNEYSAFSKYDEAADKLYLMLVYRNGPRRVSRRPWEATWRVLPNYESWLAHFRNSDANLANTLFFDIDYEKVGHIQETTRAHTLRAGHQGAVLLHRECTVSNNTNALLYGIKQDLVFGVQQGKFFAQDGKVRVYHLKGEGGEFETVILLPQCRVRLLPGGNVLMEKDGSARMVTPQGYSVLYHAQGSTILHPNGGVTYGAGSYTTPSGHGLRDGRLHTTPALKRRVPGGQIVKRDDGTVVVRSEEGEWIRFFDGTEYQVNGGRVRIEREGEPFISCQNGNLRLVADQLTIRITHRSDGHTAVLEFPDGNHLRVRADSLQVFSPEEEGEIDISIAQDQISSRFGNEEVRLTPAKSVYLRGGKELDAREEEERYGQEEALPSDCIEPRLFVISNDNTGVELLTENMYQGFLRQHSQAIDRVYERPASNATECHIVARQDQTRPKQIAHALQVSLDVFDNTAQTAQPPTHSRIALRTFLRYPPLTPADVAEMQRIRSEVEAWRKQNAKEENEFGYREPRDPATKGRIEAKLVTLRRRQEKEARVRPEALRETARQFHLATYQEIQRQLERESREKHLRSQFMKKKNSVVQEYRKLPATAPARRTRDPPQPPEFMDHYFLTAEGAQALADMPEWVFRPKQLKPAVELDPELQQQLNATNGVRGEEESEEQRERYDTVEVNLNPKPEKEIYIKPSVFTQREIDEERSAFEHEKKAYKYHEAKRKDFNVYGQERRSKPEVPTLLRTQPVSEINQKYLVTEAPLDRKVKISSMRNKLTSNASSIVEMRKEGPHTLLIKTLDKGNDINRLLERRTMMVQADLNDKLQRDILINPVEAAFGAVLERRSYELKIELKNEDVISQRITIRRPKSVHLKVALTEMGPIAMGMTRKIAVVLKAAPELLGRFTDEFDIITKHEIYHIPVTAHILSETQARTEGLHLTRGVTELDDNPRKKNESALELPRINK